MRRPSTEGFGRAIPLYALGAVFLVPLTIGVLLVSSNADQGGRANQISRDLASMYAQGVDFSQAENRSIAMRVAERLGMDPNEGVVILSKIRVVSDADCGLSPECLNNGHAVVMQRYVIGNGALRGSSFGAAVKFNGDTGNVTDWVNDASARAKDFSARLKPGEVTFAAECYLASRESGTGVYSRVMY